MPRGQFIVIEGVRGSGKSTLAKRVQEEVPDIVYLQEDPGPDFLDPNRPWANRLALAYASKTLLQSQIEPLLRSGVNVLCERWYQSIEAYLLFPHGHDSEVSRKANELFGVLEPDLTVICTVDLDVAIERVEASGREVNLFEGRGRDFMLKVCTYYNEVCDGVVADETEVRLDVILRELGVR